MNTIDWAWEQEEIERKLAPSNLNATADVEHTAGDAEVANFANLECSIIVGIDKHCSKVPGMKLDL